MRKLSKNSKAILGAATFLLFTFAGAQAGVLHLQLQRLDSSALRSQEISAPTAVRRLPVARSYFKLHKNRPAAGNSIADTSMVGSAQRLVFAGAVTIGAQSASDPTRGSSPLARAPPLS